MDEYNDILASDLPDVEKLMKAFTLVTDLFLHHSLREVEVFRAMNDREALVKEQIKLSTIESMRGIFDEMYNRITGSKV